MLLFYLRHGDPVYEPDSLTPLGERQAEALSKRLALFGIDEIYSSTCHRAYLTAKPTSELVRKDITQLDFANEVQARADLDIMENGRTVWLFDSKKAKKLFADPEVIKLYDKWYEHPEFAEYDYKQGIDRITKASDEFLKNLGYEHISGTGAYKVINDNDKRIAFFAHQGFGFAFLSIILDIPYPMFCRHFNMTHSGMTVIEFKNDEGICHPKILTLSNDSHLYREGLPLHYIREVRF